MHNVRHFMVFAMAASFALGCGESEGPELYEVTGQVVQDGEPVSQAMVTFAPNDSSQPQSTGYTNANGEFSLQTRTGGVGAVQGTHKVLITKTADAGEDGQSAKERSIEQYKKANRQGNKGAAPPEEPENVIPEKYSSANTTPLEIRVPEDTSGGGLTLSVTE